MIKIINYGLGNVNAIKNVYIKLNIPVGVAISEEDLNDATKIILPGVGSFDWAMTKLAASSMKNSLDNLVLIKKIPVLGICVGMQMMAKKSEEGVMDGLGWLDANVLRFNSSKENIKLPHMGWNTVNFLNNVISNNIINPKFYFLHSYYFSSNSETDIIGTTEYHSKFTSVINKDNIFGVQFHPEKSHFSGEKILKNFAEL